MGNWSSTEKESEQYGGWSYGEGGGRGCGGGDGDGCGSGGGGGGGLLPLRLVFFLREVLEMVTT
ncbi:hypothetical protein MAR_032114 [Mya arenaria]|uniref:Uncharacterized protein n=1 Tax=Mya arenaria TaxID=6604 RepID=A0ABY7F5T9_MYAAR|nr:hypothetical protein MAR_032114 [Mya arenaria]